MAEAKLVIENLTKTYGNGVRALDDVSLSVPHGMYGLLGPNGAGKSTLMRTLATLQAPDSGTIHLNGVNVLQNPDHLRRRLGYLPQQIGAYPGVMARNLLGRFAMLKGRTAKQERKMEVDTLLERVNLSEAADRTVATYSGGMLRRFGIAIALLGAPELLIVDEPTAGLDPVERNRFHRVLADVAATSIVLLSTHIVEDIENLCGRLAILAAGRVLAEGTPSELTAPYEGRMWERVVPRGEALPVALHAVPTPTGTRVILHADSPPDHSFLPHTPNLEDVYHLALRDAGLLEAA